MTVECNFKKKELGKKKFMCHLTGFGTIVLHSYHECAEENCIFQKLLPLLQGGGLPSEKHEISQPTSPAPPSQTYQLKPPSVQPAQQQMQLQYCPSCGKQLQPDWQICGYCGRKLKGK